MLTMNWTVNENGQVAATWEKSEGASGMPLSLLLAEEAPPVISLPSTRRQNLVASLRAALSTALHLRTAVRG